MKMYNINGEFFVYMDDEISIKRDNYDPVSEAQLLHSIAKALVQIDSLTQAVEDMRQVMAPDSQREVSV